MKKITKATFKSFLKKNEGKLFIQTNSDFDCMSDCVQSVPESKRAFVPLRKRIPSEWEYHNAEKRGMTRKEFDAQVSNNENDFGYIGVWLVGSSRNSFKHYEDEKFTGIHAYNCCGSFIVAIKKSA